MLSVNKSEQKYVDKCRSSTAPAPGKAKTAIL
jgi:hypothetical protein